MSIRSLNPATGELIKEFSSLREREIDKKITQAEAAYRNWRQIPLEERAALLRKIAVNLKKNKKKYGEIITGEMGKPISQSVAEVEKCAWVFEYYADEGPAFLKAEKVKTYASQSYVRFDPLGIILAVMPWNFPFWQVMRFAAPALLAGNVGLLKHASNVPQSALAIEEVFRSSGLPENVFQTLLISSGQVDRVIRDDRVKAVTLTGSEKAGSEVAKTAGSVIKKTVLELGGSDPFIVLPDADVEFACTMAAKARLQNAGQSCIAAKRFIVLKDVAEEFTDKLVKMFQAQIVGDPINTSTQVGPLATESIYREVIKQVDESVARGARILTGGKTLNRAGYFYEPTILTDVTPGMPVYDEEVFGPVAGLIVVDTEKEAINVANDTELGLGASIWTKSTGKAEELARDIEAGAVFINDIVKSDPRLPFGGVKNSGYGRELSHYGLREFVNIKTVWIK